MEQLTDYMNECWKAAILEERKASTIVFIPKASKALNADNLRPISLTSQVGKLMEHVALDCLSEYVEDGDEFLHSMSSFKPHLSTQDMFIKGYDTAQSMHCFPVLIVQVNYLDGAACYKSNNYCLFTVSCPTKFCAKEKQLLLPVSRCCSSALSLLILLAGDVESNPGAADEQTA